MRPRNGDPRTRGYLIAPCFALALAAALLPSRAAAQDDLWDSHGVGSEYRLKDLEPGQVLPDAVEEPEAEPSQGTPPSTGSYRGDYHFEDEPWQRAPAGDVPIDQGVAPTPAEAQSYDVPFSAPRGPFAPAPPLPPDAPIPPNQPLPENYEPGYVDGGRRR